MLHDNITELARSIDVISVNLLVTGALFIYELYITFVKLFLYIFLLSILIFRIVKEKKKILTLLDRVMLLSVKVDSLYLYITAISSSMTTSTTTIMMYIRRQSFVTACLIRV